MTPDHVNTSVVRVKTRAEKMRNSREQYERHHAMLVDAMRDAYGPFTLQEIGDAAGLSRERVRQLLKEEEK